MDILRAKVWSWAGILLIVAAVALHGQDTSSPPNRPVEKQLKEMSEGVQKNAPEAAQVFDDGIKQIAASGIVERAPKVGDTVKMFELPDASGRQVKLADLLAQGPRALTWYRGACGPCCDLAL